MKDWKIFRRFPHTFPKQYDTDAAYDGLQDRFVAESDANLVFELIEKDDYLMNHKSIIAERNHRIQMQFPQRGLTL